MINSSTEIVSLELDNQKINWEQLDWKEMDNS